MSNRAAIRRRGTDENVTETGGRRSQAMTSKTMAGTPPRRAPPGTFRPPTIWKAQAVSNSAAFPAIPDGGKMLLFFSRSRLFQKEPNPADWADRRSEKTFKPGRIKRETPAIGGFGRGCRKVSKNAGGNPTVVRLRLIEWAHDSPRPPGNLGRQDRFSAIHRRAAVRCRFAVFRQRPPCGLAANSADCPG